MGRRRLQSLVLQLNEAWSEFFYHFSRSCKSVNGTLRLKVEEHCQPVTLSVGIASYPRDAHDAQECGWGGGIGTATPVGSTPSSASPTESSGEGRL